MIWIICLILSILVLILSVMCSVNAMHKNKRIGFMTPFQALFGGLFVSVVLGILPFFVMDSAQGNTFEVRGLLYAASQAMQVFTVNAGADFLIENMSKSPMFMQTFYTWYMAVLFVLAPVITFGFLVSLFRNAFSKLRYVLRYWGEVYIFSEVQDKTLLLAKSIRKNHPKARLVFCGVSEPSEDVVEYVRGLNALLLREDILSTFFANHSKKSNIAFFLMGEERDNLIKSLKLIALYKNRSHTDVYMLSDDAEGELFLAGTDKGAVHVRRVNEARSLIYNYLYDNGFELFTSAASIQESHEKQINAIILGLGRYGTEMVKALSWYCQMDGYQLKLHVFDSDESAGDRFMTACPELFSLEYRDMITIHSGIDFEASEFECELNKITDISYVFVALDDDAKNIDLCLKFRMLMERRRLHPHLRTVISDSDEHKTIADIRNYRGQNFDIETLGSIEHIYSEKNLLGSELEKLALDRHLKWGAEEEFWKYEFNYRSSMASVIHQKMRKLCGILGAEKEVPDRTPEEREQIERLEHRRWCAYMRSEGYVYSGSTSKDSRNDLGKMHHNLVPYDLLSEEDKRKDF